MRYLKLFNESIKELEVEDSKEITDNIWTYTKEFYDEYGFSADIEVLISNCFDLSMEEIEDLSKEEFSDYIKKLLANKGQHYWNKQFNEFKVIYLNILREMKGHMTMDEIKDYFEDVSSEYEVYIRKLPGDDKKVDVTISKVPNKEVPSLINRYYNTVGARLPKEWVITRINILNKQKTEKDGNKITVSNQVSEINIIVSKIDL